MATETIFPGSIYRERKGYDFLRQEIDALYKDLSPRLSEENRYKFKAHSDTAENILKHISVNEHALDKNRLLFRERVAGTIGIAQVWDENAASQDFRKKSLLIARSLWVEDRGRQMLFEGRQIHSYGLDRRISVDILSHYFPESGGDMAWFIGKRIVNDHLVEIPDDLVGFVKLQNRIFTKYKITPNDPGYAIATGFADPRVGLAFVLKDASQKTRNHERNHIRYPGFKWGAYGASLNEGMTELLAAQEAGIKPNFFNMVRICYPTEVVFLEKLFDKYKNLEFTFEDRYKRLDHGTSLNFMVRVINIGGFNGFLNMMRARPYLGHDKKSLEIIRKTDQLPTRSLYQSLKVK